MRLIHIFSITFFIIVFSQPVFAAQQCGVILQDANLRSGAGTQFKTITALLKGTKIEKKDRQNNWLLIQVPSLDKTGWVHYQLIKNQQCKKFPPLKTLKPTATKTAPPSAQQTKDISTADKTPGLGPVVKKENAPTAKLETTSPKAPQKKISEKKAEAAGIVPATSIREETLSERQTAPDPTILINDPQLSHSTALNPATRPTAVIGIIDIQKVINSSKRGKAARMKYEKIRLAGQSKNIDLAEEELITNVIIEIQAIVETFSLQHGFTHILNKNSGAIFYNDHSYNITDDIIREYDRQVSLKHITP